MNEPRLVLDALAIGVIVHDAALRIVYANRAAAALLGVEISEAVERDIADPFWVVIHPDGSSVPHEEVPASVALRTRKPVGARILGVKQRDGVTNWLAVDAVPMLNAAGDVRHVAVTILDVTRELVARMQLERVRDSLGRTIQERDAALSAAVQALDSSEARYRAVLRSMSEGVAVHAADGGIVFANPAAERILGLTLQQMQGQHPVDPAWRLTDASGRPLPPEQIPSEITRRTGEPQRAVSLGVQRATGDHAWLSVSTDPIAATSEPDGPGGSYSVVATFTDVTSEREALADARAARDHLSSIAASLPGVVVEYLLRADGSDQFRYVSEPGREYLGVEPEAALRDSAAVWTRVHPEDLESTRSALLSASRDCAAVQLEFRVRHLDGRYHYARWRSGAPSKLSEGVLFCAVVFDVTEQRRLEETVREAQRREAIGTLAAGMAHNFNNMLAVILPSLEMLQDTAPELKRDLDDARTAAGAAAELVRQLMQLVRKDTGQGAVPIELGQLVEEIGQLCRRTFDAGIEISCISPAGGCTVLARRSELQQALVNLCINARDALEQRPNPRLEIRVSAESASALVVVADNGSGMSTETQRRLGEPFFSTKPPGRGTGLGLATVYGIVAELRGTLRCHSEIGVGTRFELRLPRLEISPPTLETSVEQRPVLARLCVLVIDDEELVRSTLQRALERYAVRVITAATGAEGLALFQANPDINLVLLDLSMPELSGQEVLRRMRQFSESVPVYVLTGFLPDGIDLVGATGVLTKPVDLSRLRSLLKDVASA